MPRRINLLKFDRRRVCGRRVVFPPADLDVWYLTRLLLRLSRSRRRQVGLLAHYLLLEDEQTNLELDAASSGAVRAPVLENLPSRDPG